jgi:hypothetical protein
MYSSGEAHSRFPAVFPRLKIYLLLALPLQPLLFGDDAYDGDDDNGINCHNLVDCRFEF